MALNAFVQIHLALFGEYYSAVVIVLSVLTLNILIFGLKKMHSLLMYIPLIRFDRILYSESYGTIWEGLMLTSKTKYYHWVLALRGILLAYLCVFFDIYPLIQLSFLIVFQIGLMASFIEGLRIQRLFSFKVFNVLAMIEELSILITKLMILTYLLASMYGYHNYLQVIGWLIVGPLLFNKLARIIYSSFNQFQNRKKIWLRIK